MPRKKSPISALIGRSFLSMGGNLVRYRLNALGPATTRNKGGVERPYVCVWKRTPTPQDIKEANEYAERVLAKEEAEG